MSEEHLSEYDQFNIDQDKLVKSCHSGKQRSKKEAEQHTNRHDPSGHTRKTVQKLMNNEQKQKDKAKETDSK